MSAPSRKKIYVCSTEAHWAVAEGVRDGKPVFVRRNKSAISLVGDADFRFCVGVAIPLRKPNAHGLPINAEIEQLNAIEDELREAMEVRQESLLVLIITTSGMREFVFYTRSPAMAVSAIEGLRRVVRTHEIQSHVTEDPEWSIYSRFAPRRTRSHLAGSARN